MRADPKVKCVEELRRKALYYEKSGIIPTLDACASVAKSDKLVTPHLHEQLRAAFKTLRKDQATSPDWHPNSNDMVQDLVHPSMYPLVYGRSKVLKTESVGVEDAINKWAAKGTVIKKDRRMAAESRRPYMFREESDGYWSDTYQWLPANVAFQDDGSVRFTSYINNLHPTKYPEIYQAIEKLIETALPAWDQCLSLYAGQYGDFTREGAGRMHSRFSTTMPDNKE